MPSLACGRIFMVHDGAAQYNGTGAMFGKQNVVLTAGHCVPPIPGAHFLFKSTFADSPAWEAVRVERHPKSDVAVMIGPADVRPNPAPIFAGFDPHPVLIDGGDFIAFGYPAEGNASVGRLFKGHFQRYLGYESPDGRGKYFAGELSVPAPAGLSGGPVSMAHTPHVICGVVTANHDSYLLIDSFEETQIDGTVNRGSIKRVVSYGIAAMLVDPEMQSWINELVASA